MILISISITREHHSSTSKTPEEGRRVLLTEILLPRIAGQGTVCLVSTRG